MLRELRIADPPRRLLERSGAELVALPRPDLCCGFGGTFSVRQPEVSVAMADDKLSGAAGVGADALVTADPGCLMHLRGRAQRVGTRAPARPPGDGTRARRGGERVTDLAQPPGRFREIARLKLADGHIQGALDSSTARLYGNRAAAWEALPEVEELRQRAHDARMRVIDDLDTHIDRFTGRARGARRTGPLRAHRRRRGRLRHRRLPSRRRQARGEVEVDG